MCLYPKVIKNPKFTANKKNGGIIPPVNHKGTMYVPIACKKCLECMKKKSREWAIRLKEELKTTNIKGYFVTLTYSNEAIKELNDYIEEKENLAKSYMYHSNITKKMHEHIEKWKETNR